MLFWIIVAFLLVRSWTDFWRIEKLEGDLNELWRRTVHYPRWRPREHWREHLDEDYGLEKDREKIAGLEPLYPDKDTT